MLPPEMEVRELRKVPSEKAEEKMLTGLVSDEKIKALESTIERQNVLIQELRISLELFHKQENCGPGCKAIRALESARKMEAGNE